MAELGIVASALQIADLGIRLSLRLYTFGETVAGADKSIISISKEVSLTSTVLKELGQTLGRDQTARICSPNAVQTAESIAKECRGIFQDMDQVLVKKFANTKSAEKDRRIKAAQTLERLRWPFIKGKIELLTSNLERQKSTLVLMLNVITLAKQEYERTEPYTMIAEQRSLIQDLARSNEDYTRKFEQLKLSCDSVPVHPEPILADHYNSRPTPKITTTQGSVHASAVGATSLRGPSTGAQGLGPGPYMGSWYFHEPDTSLPDQISWLQQQYRKLMSTLLMEVSAPTYEIADDSRSRIKAEIVTIHIREMEHMEQIQYSRPASLARPMVGPVQEMQLQQCSYSSLMQNQQMQGQQQHSYSSLKPNQQMQIQQIQAHQKSRMRNQQTQAQQQSFSGPIPIEQMQQSFNSQRPLQQMQAQQQSFNGSIPGEQMQGQQQSFSSQSAWDYSASKINWGQIGTPHKALPMPQNATYQYHSLQPLGMGANSHSTRGEHEQTSAAQSRPPMASMSGASPPLGGPSQHSAMGPMAATPRYGTSSSGVYSPATTLDSETQMPLSKPLPYWTSLSLSPAAQSPFQGRHHTLPNPDEAVAQESSNYGPSVPQNCPPRAESPTLVSQGHASKPVSSRTSGASKRKLDSTGLSSQLPVIDPYFSHSKNISSSPRLYKNARRRNDHTAVTENTKTSEVGASGEMHRATSCKDSGNQKENNAVYSRDAISYNAHREISLERTLENHTPEDWAENVVDELLAAWTTLPVSAIRPASQHAGFAVVAV